MQVHVDDDGFVRAPKGLVYRVLTDVERWPTWWPGCEVRRAPGHDDAWAVKLTGGRGRRAVRLVVRPHGWRHDEGFTLDVAGDLRGRGEFWLEEGWGGTVVHHLLGAEVLAARPRSVLPAYRASLRRGLGGVKDALQSEVRRRLDLIP